MKGLTVNKIKIFLPLILFLGISFSDCLGGVCFGRPKRNPIEKRREEVEGYETESEEEWFGTKRKIKFVPLWKWLLKAETK